MPSLRNHPRLRQTFQKPLPGATLDRTHRFARGLLFCGLFNEGGAKTRNLAVPESLGTLSGASSGVDLHMGTLNPLSSGAGGRFGGKFGNELVCPSGTTEQVSFPHRAEYVLSANAFTFAAHFWMANPTSTLQFLLDKDSGAGASDYYWYIGNAPNIVWGYQDTGGAFHDNSVNYAFAANTYYRVHVVISGTAGAAYVNGLLVGTTSTTGTIKASVGGPLYVVKRVAGGFNGLLGGISDLFLWNRALSAQEVLDHTRDPYALLRTAAGRGRSADQTQEAGVSGALMPTDMTARMKELWGGMRG